MQTRHWYVFQHQAHEGPGHLDAWAKGRGVTLKVVRLDRGEAVPPPSAAAEVEGLIVLGGPMSVHDPIPYLAAERALIEAVLAQKRRVLGLCLGAQQLALASRSGTVGPMLQQEIGYHPVVPTALGAKLLGASWPNSVSALHWHQEHVVLHKSAGPLLRSEACAVQAYLTPCGFGMGLQFHPEVMPSEIAAILRDNAADLAAGGAFVQTAAHIAAAAAGVSSWPTFASLLTRFFDGVLADDKA